MINASRRVLCGCAFAAVLIPASVQGQTIAHSFDELQRIVKAGQTVIVTDANGEETRGRIISVSESSLVVFAWGGGRSRKEASAGFGARTGCGTGC